jgi:hypothetical protein
MARKDPEITKGATTRARIGLIRILLDDSLLVT